MHRVSSPEGNAIKLKLHTDDGGKDGKETYKPQLYNILAY